MIIYIARELRTRVILNIATTAWNHELWDDGGRQHRELAFENAIWKKCREDTSPWMDEVDTERRFY
jgi:hypothetical protein